MSDENDAVFKLFTKRMMISEQQASPSGTTHMIDQGEEPIRSSLNFEYKIVVSLCPLQRPSPWNDLTVIN